MKYLSAAKLSSCFRYLTVVLTLLCFVFSAALTAQVTTINGWSNLYNGTSSPGNLTYTVSAGSDSHRLLVVGVAITNNSPTTRTVAITYGGQTLTPVTGDLSISIRQHTQLYYLDEAGLDAATNNTLAVSISGTVRRNAVFAVVYDNVDQANPVTSSQNSYKTRTSSNIQFSPGIDINPDDQALKILCSDRNSSSARTISNFGTNWSINEQLADNSVRNAVGSRSIPNSSVTDISSTTLSGSSYLSMTGMSISAKKYFRSVQTGNWSSTSTWQQSIDNATWTAANSIPTRGHDLTTIQSGHTVTLTANATVSSLTIHGTPR